MNHRAGALALLSILFSATSASSAELPAIKVDQRNAVPACATPGRMTAFLKSRNDALDARFDAIAVEYMRLGEELSVRWDYVFFQMMLETGNLSYKRGNRQGDVKLRQYNFAGLGATGGGEAGESFPDMKTGVRAHLEHIRLYAGDPVSAPVAERTRKVQEWGVLNSWQKTAKQPISFRELTMRWAKDSGYGGKLQSIAAAFYDDFCNKADPNPEMLALVRGGRDGKVAAADDAADRPNGTELARQAVERARKDGDGRRVGLGATRMAKPKTDEAAAVEPVPEGSTKIAAAPPGSVRILNAPKPEETAIQGDKPAPVTPVVAGSGTKPGLAPPAPETPQAGKCRVWTASYGGQKAVIIKSVVDQIVNYTVLDVNDGAEKREAEAYIAAYAKGGVLMLEFASQNQALDKAFDLCPDG
jgi:hypothetical protein